MEKRRQIVLGVYGPYIGAGEGQSIHTITYQDVLKPVESTQAVVNFSKGDIVWGHHHRTQGPPNTGHHDKMTLEQCRQRMKRKERKFLVTEQIYTRIIVGPQHALRM